MLFVIKKKIIYASNFCKFCLSLQLILQIIALHYYLSFNKKKKEILKLLSKIENNLLLGASFIDSTLNMKKGTALFTRALNN